MAPSSATSDNELSIQEIIFSCGICQATVSELYATPEDNQGFSSDPLHGDGIITKLWIGECSHIFCGKHLEGGAAPFHPKGMAPRAACPVCVQDTNDESMKELFGIRGLEDGQYDAVVPKDYLKCPPSRLDANDRQMDALRFQYSHLVRQAKKCSKRWRSAESKRVVLENALSKERKQVRKAEKELRDLQQQNKDITIKLQKWESRKEIIKHYMDAVHEMTLDIHAMRNKLTELGYDVPHKRYGLEPPEISGQSQTRPPKTTGDSSTTLVDEQHQSSSSRKRKMPDYDPYADNRDRQDNHGLADYSSRLMMPPPLPNLRLRQPEQSHADPLPSEMAAGSQRTEHRSFQQHRPLQTFENGSWQDADTATQPDLGFSFPRQPYSQRPNHYEAPDHGRLPLQMSQMNIAPRNYTIGQRNIHSRYDRGEDFRRDAIEHFQPQRVPLLAQPPRRRGLEEYHAMSRDLTSRAHEPTQHHPRPSSHFSQYNSGYGATIQQPGHDPTGTIRVQPAPAIMRDDHSRFSSQALPTTSHCKRAEPPASSVLSPFFKGRAGSSRHGEVPRPYAQGSGVGPPMLAPSTRHDRSDGQIRGTMRESMPLPHRTTLNSSFFVQDLRGSSHQRSGAFDTSGRHYPSDYQRHSMRENASYGQSQRSHLPPPSNAGLHPPPPASQAARSRMTLPPSSSKGPRYASNQDSQLSKIRGVRAAGPSRGLYSRQSIFPANYQPRSLTSAVSNRRIIQR